MKTGRILFFSLFLIIENCVNAQIFTDSIQFGGDKSIPSRVILSTRQKTALTQRTKSLDKVAKSRVILEQALSLDENTTAELQGRNADFNGNEHVSFHQYYKGIKVENTRSIVHYKNGEANSVNGNFRTVGDLSVNSQLSESEALQYALSHIGAKKYMWEDEANEKWIKAEQEDSLATFYPKGEPVIYFNKEDTPVLTYKFDIYAGNPLRNKNK